MGTDGHTASLFPCSDDLKAAVEEQDLLCKAVQPKTAPFERMTLTLKTLLQSSKIYLQLAGQAKYDVFQTALEDGASAEMPIRYFLSDTNPLIVYWSAE